MRKSKGPLPIILGGRDFKKGIMVFKWPGLNGYDLGIVRLKKEFPPGTRFEIDDVENVQAVLHFSSLSVVKTMANALNHIMEEWENENHD